MSLSGNNISPRHHGITISQYIQEEGDDSRIYEVCKHGTNDGDDEERLDGIAVFITYSTHVGHRIGGCAKTESTHACTEDGGITSQRAHHSVPVCDLKKEDGKRSSLLNVNGEPAYQNDLLSPYLSQNKSLIIKNMQ